MSTRTLVALLAALAVWLYIAHAIDDARRSHPTTPVACTMMDVDCGAWPPGWPPIAPDALIAPTPPTVHI